MYRDGFLIGYTNSPVYTNFSVSNSKTHVYKIGVNKNGVEVSVSGEFKVIGLESNKDNNDSKSKAIESIKNQIHSLTEILNKAFAQLKGLTAFVVGGMFR